MVFTPETMAFLPVDLSIKFRDERISMGFSAFCVTDWAWDG